MRTYFHYFNVLFVLFCSIGSIIYGEGILSFFLLLAAIQLFSATVILLVKSYNLKSFKEILIYWTLVIIYFLVVIDLIQNRTLKLLIIPMLIASYHCYVTYKLLKKSFLTAEWNNLALINYEINPKILENYIPKGTELDLWNGKCYVSLVGFMFENVKLLGLKIPFHINFEEVNLRFYVKRFENNQWKRGAVFIKEIVPKPALTFVANTIYKEHYQTLPMKHSVTENNNSIDFVYQWKDRNKWNSIIVETEKNPIEIEPTSEAEFITEHYFGYTKVNDETTFEYEVKHQRWRQYKVTNQKIDVDFNATYGSEFDFLKNEQPISVILAKGSEISVENKKRL